MNLSDNPYMPPGHHWELDGEIGLGKCDHDVCICGVSFVDVHGYKRSTVPHSGVWRIVPDEHSGNGNG